MAGQTALRKLPFAQGADPLQAWPAVSESLAELLDASLFAPATKAAADRFDTWPLGVSVQSITGAQATAGGWPAGSWQLLTIRRSINDQAAQFLCESASTGNAEVRYRSGTANGWSPWFQVVSKSTARAMHAGTYTFTATAAPVSRAISFPSGTFQTPPFVVVSGSHRDALFTATSVTKDGFSANVDAIAGASSAARRITWHAIELNNAEA